MWVLKDIFLLFLLNEMRHKLVFAHTKEGEDVCKRRVCDTHGTHESIMQTSHFVCIKAQVY
jgi:hypothetical protein